MRLIDADLLKESIYGWDVASVIDIDAQPTIDAVPVVRCTDCKYFHYSKPHGILMMNLVCDKWGKGCRTSPDGYCFMGERREK